MLPVCLSPLKFYAFDFVKVLLSRPDMRVTQADLLVSEGEGRYWMQQLCLYSHN